jgi:hypothetical protein
MQYMFLKLHDIEDPEKKAFILETLRIEFRDVTTAERLISDGPFLLISDGQTVRH